MSSTKPLPDYSRVNIFALPPGIPVHIAKRSGRAPVLKPGQGTLKPVPENDLPLAGDGYDPSADLPFVPFQPDPEEDAGWFNRGGSKATGLNFAQLALDPNQTHAATETVPQNFAHFARQPLNPVPPLPTPLPSPQPNPARQVVQPPMLKPSPTPQPTPAPEHNKPQPANNPNPFARARGQRTVAFTHDALVQEVQKMTLSSTAVTDATELMEAAPNPNAINKFCNAFKRAASKIPQGDEARQGKAQSVSAWLHNVNFVGIDEDLHDIILRKFTQESRKVQKRGIRHEFAWMTEDQEKAITNLLARRFTYQQLQGWVQNADSLTVEVRQALYPESFR